MQPQVVNEALASNKAATSARIESVIVKNFRVLKHLEFKKLTPMTVLIGPNGSGKSTVLDVFAFLSECFEYGLRYAWDRRGRSKELKTHGATGPVVIEIKYRETIDNKKLPLITYRLGLDEDNGSPVIVEERLRWKRKSHGKPYLFLDFHNGQGFATSGDEPDETANRTAYSLESPDLLAVNALGQFNEHPRVVALRRFIRDWHLSYLSLDVARFQPEAGPQKHLSTSGDNIANVLQFLSEQHSDKLEQIFIQLRECIPLIEKAYTQPMPDGRLLLQFQDRLFEQPVLARFASDGTLKLLAYLILLNAVHPRPFIGIEEPENFLHPQLLPVVANKIREASGRTQMLVTTHSPYLLDTLTPNQVRILYRSKDDGCSRVVSAADREGVKELVETGGALGDLWMEGHFGVGNPLFKDAALR